ncbi:HVO_2922 family protein [Haloarchaeobius sp. DFWS5]|uniref:HVO_2922 family protein n=1 Tax=Haloarchaeobius sp. DFWS5 TaxID=3446114 RepID=UPI003EBA048C
MSKHARFEVFEDNAGEWRWRLVASNGNIIADSGEGYKSKQGATRGIRSVKRSAPAADVEIVGTG